MNPPHSIIKGWNDVILRSLEIATGEPTLRLGPPMVARLLAMVYTAAFQAWAPYTATATPPIAGGAPRRPAAQWTEKNKRIAISFAIYRTALDLMPEPRIKALLDAQMAALGLDINETDAIGNDPDEIGNAAAKAVLTARANDGANQSGLTPGSPPPPPPPGKPTPYVDYTGYVPVNRQTLVAAPTPRDTIVDVEKWQPLTYADPTTGSAATPSFIAPHWKNVTPFALTSADQFRPSAPERYTSQAFLDQARHVIEVQANLTSEQKVIAEYWADGPRSWLPPGHWCEIAGQISERRFHTTDQDAQLFFAVANAILDASISCWESKVFYDYCRPVTAIRWLFGNIMIDAWGGPGRGTVRMRGDQWRPFQRDTFPTPPFSEYASGHSTFSMAAATVLKAFLGFDRFELHHDVTEPLLADPGLSDLPRRITWHSFTDAAYSAGESRIFGGIHFYQGNVAGLDAGRKVGEAVWTRAKTFF
ncbi:vanadium-dependent haloperoxidase [Accumulibacter sp.]|uniref:vanadium-dependent haloperoxidase n=1 Tax=Accumulibacter sp. TaxID=2053492 RepID=UPI001AD51778|nr:vanadium-dependent haloperoxidase [Accumulibacter sp.]MBN8455790.1 vanadium-dependent haloperoxidase [Accumulibacter sp.]